YLYLPKLTRSWGQLVRCWQMKSVLRTPLGFGLSLALVIALAGCEVLTPFGGPELPTEREAAGPSRFASAGALTADALVRAPVGGGLPGTLNPAPPPAPPAAVGPVMGATLSAALATDADGDGFFDPGDVIQ